MNYNNNKSLSLLFKLLQGLPKGWDKKAGRKHHPNAFMAVPVSWVSVKVLS